MKIKTVQNHTEYALKFVRLFGISIKGLETITMPNYSVLETKIHEIFRNIIAKT